MAVKPKQYRDPYDPMKTPAGQRLTAAQRAQDAANHQVFTTRRKIRGGANSVFPGLGDDLVTSDAGVALSRAARETAGRRVDAAIKDYQRQESAAASGFARHLAVPGKTPPAATRGAVDPLKRDFDAVRQAGEPPRSR